MKTNIKNFRSFLKNENGNILIMTAFSLLFLFAVAGASIDFGTAYLIKNKSQQATDFAALSAALLPANDGTTPINTLQQQAIARYYNLNFPKTYLGVDRQVPTQDLTNQSQITVTSGNYAVPTNFIKNTDKSNIIVSQGTTVSTDISKTEQKYDVIVSMDNSSSMGGKYSKNDKTIRLDALKTAVGVMTDIFLNDPNIPVGFNRMAGNTWAPRLLTSKDFTSDHAIYQAYINGMSINKLVGGTSSTTGLLDAKNIAKGFRTDVVRALVLISDGENNFHTSIQGVYICNNKQNACINVAAFQDVVNNESLAICNEFKNMIPKTVVYSIIATDGNVNAKATDFMKHCASGDITTNLGKFYFEAKSADELKNVFITIANSIKSIRITN